MTWGCSHYLDAWQIFGTNVRGHAGILVSALRWIVERYKNKDKTVEAKKTKQEISTYLYSKILQESILETRGICHILTIDENSVEYQTLSRLLCDRYIPYDKEQHCKLVYKGICRTIGDSLLLMAENKTNIRAELDDQMCLTFFSSYMEVVVKRLQYQKLDVSSNCQYITSDPDLFKLRLDILSDAINCIDSQRMRSATRQFSEQEQEKLKKIRVMRMPMSSVEYIRKRKLNTEPPIMTPLEAMWHNELYKGLCMVLGKHYEISPEFGNLWGVKGQVDFYINNKIRLGVELLRNEADIDEHINRFSNEGNYEPLFTAGVITHAFAICFLREKTNKEPFKSSSCDKVTLIYDTYNDQWIGITLTHVSFHINFYTIFLKCFSGAPQRTNLCTEIFSSIEMLQLRRSGSW